MNRVFLLFLFLAWNSLIYGQKYKIDGTVMDEKENIPLIGAVVILLHAQDSTMASYGVANENGYFSLEKIQKGSYKLQLTYVGYTPVEKSIIMDGAEPILHLGNITLGQEGKLLDQVTISAEYVPIKITKDTMEYNADAFKTQPNAVVEDLLKKLPGVEVGSDGAISVKGEEVKAVTVDGKDFFGKDPKIATKNLPADAVKKVQIFEKKSKTSEFTGINDGQDEMTINLELKEGRKNGYFGNIMGGYGTDDKYESKAMINKFGGKAQISLLGGLNNINNSGINVEDYISMTSAGSSGRGSRRISINSSLPLSFGPNNNGVIKSGIAGINTILDLNPKNRVSLSYFYSNTNSSLIQNSTSNQFLQEGSLLNLKNSTEHRLVQNHNLNLKYEVKIDSMSELTLSGSGSLNYSDQTLSAQDTTLTNNTLKNTSIQDNSSNSDNFNVNTSANYRRKFKKFGRNFTIDGTYSNSASNAINDVLNYVYDNANVISGDASALQYQTNDNSTDYYSLAGTYTEPLSTYVFYTFNSSFRNNRNDLLKDFYDIDIQNPTIKELNELLSQSLDNRFNYYIAGSSIRMQKANYNMNVGMDYQYSTLLSDPSNASNAIDRSFNYVLPRANIRFDNLNLRFDYSTSIREPSIEQLQPVVDNSDPLNLYIGNPFLIPEYRHSIRINFNKFNQFNFRGFFSGIRLGYNKNRITTATTIDENYIKTRTPLNTKDEKTASANVTYVSPLNFMKAKFRISANSSLTNGINYVVSTAAETNRWSNGFNVLLENKLKEKMDISVGTRWSFTSNDYLGHSDLNTSYINNSYEANATIYLKKAWTVSSKYNWYQYKGEAFQNASDVHLLEASISKRLLDDKLTIGLRAFDLLDQNKGIERTASETYISEVISNTIGRYFMLNVTYSLSKLGNNSEGGPQHIMIDKR
ncbi:MAG: TonB-dependent receptor [Lewinellaceae bacterium]|nr:TonB-dependent receptor [Lewinellaceae bacterium]